MVEGLPNIHKALYRFSVSLKRKYKSFFAYIFHSIANPLHVKCIIVFSKDSVSFWALRQALAPQPGLASPSLGTLRLQPPKGST